MTSQHIVLVIPPISQINYPYIAVPLLKAVASKANYSVKVHDVNMAYFNYLVSRDPEFANIKDADQLNTLFTNFDPYAINPGFTKTWLNTCAPESRIFGFSLASSFSLPWSLEAAQGLKRLCKEAMIIFGGVFCDEATARYILADHSAVDMVVLGEGEETLLDILQRYYGSGGNRYCLSGIKGTAIRNGREVVINDSRPLLTDLDSLPFPDYSSVQIEDYLNYKCGTRILPVLGSRGCTGHCSFCVEWKIWAKYRPRSADNVVEEIRYLIDKYDVNMIRFNNSLVNGNLRILEDFCDRMIEADLGITWVGNARIRKGMTKRLLKKMYLSGCRYLWYGIESASPRMLKIMKKNYDIAQASRILKETKEAGIMILTFWITNFPGEKWEDTENSINFFRTNGQYIDFPRLKPFQLYKGTDIALNPEKYGIIIKDFDVFGNPIWDYTGETFDNTELLTRAGVGYCNANLIPCDFVGIL